MRGSHSLPQRDKPLCEAKRCFRWSVTLFFLWWGFYQISPDTAPVIPDSSSWSFLIYGYALKSGILRAGHMCVYRYFRVKTAKVQEKLPVSLGLASDLSWQRLHT